MKLAEKSHTSRIIGKQVLDALARKLQKLAVQLTAKQNGPRLKNCVWVEDD